MTHCCNVDVMCMSWYRIGENVANITLVDSSNIDVWSVWSELTARRHSVDDNMLLL